MARDQRRGPNPRPRPAPRLRPRAPPSAEPNSSSTFPSSPVAAASTPETLPRTPPGRVDPADELRVDRVLLAMEPDYYSRQAPRPSREHPPPGGVPSTWG